MYDEVKVMPTISVQEVDRTGAGAIFDGALLYALWKKYDIEKAIRVANIAAGLSTTKYGVKDSIPLLSEVINYYEQRFGPLEVVEQQVNVDPNAQTGQTVSQNNVPPQQTPVESQVQGQPVQNVQTNQTVQPQTTPVVPPVVPQNTEAQVQQPPSNPS